MSVFDRVAALNSPIQWLIRQVQAMGFEWVFHRYYGIYRALVIDVADPEKRGRVRVQVPSIGQATPDDVPIDQWALPCMPGLSVGKKQGQMHGDFHPPNVDDQVWVNFEEGDTRYPVYVGGWLPRNQFKGDELIDDAALKKGIRTATGHFIRMSDDPDDLHITISKGDGSGGASGTFITLSKDEEVIVATANGNVVHLSNEQTTVFAPDGANMQLGDGRAMISDADGNSFGLEGGKFQVSCDEAVITATKKITLRSNVDLGTGPFQPIVQGRVAALLHATHTHTVTVPSIPNTPQIGAPMVPGNGLSLTIRTS